MKVPFRVRIERLRSWHLGLSQPEQNRHVRGMHVPQANMIRTRRTRRVCTDNPSRCELRFCILDFEGTSFGAAIVVFVSSTYSEW